MVVSIEKQESVSIRVTDDEVVAAALSVAKTWPHVLPTVEVETQALLEANARGLRSLLVRDLAHYEHSGFVLDSSLESLVTRASEAAGTVMAYVGESASPQILAGTSSFLFLSGDKGSAGVLDLVSPDGVHDLIEFGRAEAIEVFLSVIHNAFVHGVAAGTKTAAMPCLFVRSTLAVGWIEVSQGKASFGDVVSGEPDGEFQARSSSDHWDPEQVVIALGLEKVE